MKICDKCGAANQDHSKFCLRCGAGLQENAASVQNSEHGSHEAEKVSNQCPQCQYPYEAGELFCANCGYKFVQPETDASPSKEAGDDMEAAQIIPVVSESDSEQQAFQDDSYPETESDSEIVPDETTDEGLVSELTSVSPAAFGSDQDAADKTEPMAADDSESGVNQASQSDQAASADEASGSSDTLAVQQQEKEAAVLTAPKFCSRCGQAVVKDAAFCRNCGHNLKKGSAASLAAAPASKAGAAGAVGAAAYNHTMLKSGQPGPSAGSSPMASPAPYPAPPPPQGAQPFSGYQQSSPQTGAAYTPPGYQPPSQPAKPKRRKGLVALMIILVIILAGGATYLFAGQTIRRMIMGNKAAYLAIEGQQLKQNAEDLSEWLADMGNKSERPAAGGHSMVINFDLPDYGTGMDPVLQSALENITWHTRIMYDQASTPSRYYAGIDLQTGSEPLLSIEGYYDEDQLIFGVPGLLSRYLWIQRDMVDEYGDGLGIDTAEADEALRALDIYMNLDLGINEARLAGSMYQIIDIILDHIDEVEYSADEELTVGPVRQTYNRYTMTLGHESARQMMIELLSFIRDDPEIYNLVSGMANLSMASDPYYTEMGITFSREEFQSEIDWMLEDLEDADDVEPFTIINDIYVDSDDQIFGRYFRIVPESGPAVFEYKDYRPRSGSQSAVEITVITEGEDMQYQNIYELSGERKTGEIFVRQNNQVIMSAEYSDYEKVTIGSRDYFLGDFRFRIYENNTEMAAIAYNAVQNGNEVQMQFGAANFGHITVAYEEIPEQDLSFPSFTGDQLINITDTEALSTLMTEDAMMELFRIMQQLGLSPEDF